MASAEPAVSLRRAITAQTGDKVVACHWPFPPAAVDRLLPDGLVADVHDGHAWAGLVSGVRTIRAPRVLPPPPLIGRWREVVVRVHVRGPDGTRGVFALSTLTDHLLPALAQRLLGVRARRARIHLATGGNVVVYETRRRKLRSEVAVEVAEPLPPQQRGAAERFVSSARRRYGIGRNGLWTLDEDVVEDDLYLANPLHLEDDLVAAAGLPAPVADPVVLYSGRTEVRAGRRVGVGSHGDTSVLRIAPPPGAVTLGLDLAAAGPGH